MVFLIDTASRLLIRISKRNGRRIPITKIGKGIFLTSKQTQVVLNKLAEHGFVVFKGIDNMKIVELTSKGNCMCKDLFNLREKWGDDIVYKR